jgi:hypothetical protein
MGHSLCGLILKGPYHSSQAQAYDLHGVALGFDLTLFPINSAYTIYWQHHERVMGLLNGPVVDCAIFPRERVLAVLMARITAIENPLFAILLTDYFGGQGQQWAQVYQGELCVDPAIARINAALDYLGVRPAVGQDAFDAIGLGLYRRQPTYLDVYAERCEALGL